MGTASMYTNVHSHIFDIQFQADTAVRHLFSIAVVLLSNYAATNYTSLYVVRCSWHLTNLLSADTSIVSEVSWLQGPETGLPAPDLVLYLRLPHVEVAAQRGGYGDER